MINSKYIGILSGLAFTLFLLGLNGSDLGMPGFITSNRIALALLLLINILIVYKKDQITINKNVLMISIVFVLISVWGFISILISPYHTKTSVSPIITCILISITLLLISNILLSNKDNFYEYFLNSVILLGAIISVFYFTWGYLYVGNLTDNYMWRVSFSRTTNGLNRVMNGMLVIGIVNLLVLFLIIKRKKIYIFSSLITLTSFFTLIIVTGSRQTLIGLITAVLAVFLVTIFSSNRFRVNLVKLSVVTPLIASMIFIFFRKYELSTWFMDRFVNRTLEGSTSDESRAVVLKEAFSYLENNPFFGVGPGVFPSINSYGLSTHNGYVYMLVSYGLLPTVILLIIIIASLLFGLKSIKKINNMSVYNIYLFSLITVIVFFFVSNLFNDLIDEYFFWIMIVFLVATPIRYKSQSKFGCE